MLKKKTILSGRASLTRFASVTGTTESLIEEIFQLKNLSDDISILTHEKYMRALALAWYYYVHQFAIGMLHWADFTCAGELRDS